MNVFPEKARKQALKEEKRQKRAGAADVGKKPCDLCQRDRNLLIRYESNADT